VVSPEKYEGEPGSRPHTGAPPFAFRGRLGDHLIVASALTDGLELAPLNTRHYPVFSDVPCPF
jgi:hypothetical protein